MVRLFTTFFYEGRKERRAEYLNCLEQNIDCKEIDEVCILSEAGHADGVGQSPKLFVRAIEARPTYDDFFGWINEVAKASDISIIANADIWFDSTIGIARRSLNSNEAYALARWDGGTLFHRNDSQDSWVFRGKVKAVTGDFRVGVPRCDNRLLYELQAAGYTVLNPAFSIITHHVHAGLRNEYGQDQKSDFVEPPYRYLWPHNLWNFPVAVMKYLRRRDEPFGWRFDKRKVFATMPFRVLRKIRRFAPSASAQAVDRN